MAKNLKELFQTRSEVEIRGLILHIWVGVARGHLKIGNKVPEEIWAKMAKNLDELIELLPPYRWRV